MNARGLKLDVSNVGIGTEKKENIQEHWDTFDQIEGKITMLGLGELHQPDSECPFLTAEMLNEPDSIKYAENQACFAAWLGFATELLARVDAQILQYENMLLVMAAETKKTYREMNLAAGEKKLSADEIKQRLDLSPEYQSIKHQLQQVQQQRLLLKARVETLDGGIRALSRRIELTKMDREGDRRAQNSNSRFQR